MPSVDRPLKVFLCHAHADRDPVRALYALTKVVQVTLRAKNPLIRYAIR
jgi:hypothetical protein